MNEATRLAKERLTELLDLLGIEATIEASVLAEQEILMIDSKEQALLIGRSGENLRALQHLVNILVRQNLLNAETVMLDVADYKKNQLKKLQMMAYLAAEQAKTSGKAVHLRPMNAYQRRIIHLSLAEKPEVTTESSGEEPNRKIIVKKRQ